MVGAALSIPREAVIVIAHILSFYYRFGLIILATCAGISLLIVIAKGFKPSQEQQISAGQRVICYQGFAIKQ
jgi:hypothetical protein